jgi:hypothetical protein
MKTRILDIIQKFEHGNKSRFGRAIGVQSGLVGDWCIGKAKPGTDYRNEICKSYKINPNWLDTGNGEMLVSAMKNVDKMYDEKDMAIKVLEARLQDSQNLNDKYLDRIESALKSCAETQTQKKPADNNAYSNSNS